MKDITSYAIGILIAAIFSGCATMKSGHSGVEGFDREKYLGTWYEIARFDFVFERGLNNTTAEYSLTDSETIIGVTNRGYDFKAKRWKQAVGRARFRGDESRGELEVSFFGPFWGEYAVLALDEGYRYALVAGKKTDYLWILSRTKTIPHDIILKYLGIAEGLGFDTDRLLWIEHDGA